MTKILLAIYLLVGLWSITPLVSSNAHMDASKYGTVQVKEGDSVWSIAANYVTDKEDIRELTQGINQLNSLGNNAQIFPGQVLKVPIK